MMTFKGARYRVLLSNMVSQYGLQLAKYVFPLITTPYLTRVLGVDGFGVRAYVLAVMTLMQTLVDFGFNLSATKSIVKNSYSPQAVGTIVSSVLLAKIGIVTLSGSVLLGISLFIPVLNENIMYVIISFVAVILNGFLPDYLFIGLEKMGVLTRRYVVVKSIATLLTFVLIKSEKDLLLVPTIEVIASAIALAWTWKSACSMQVLTFSRPSLKKAWVSFKDSALYFVTNFSASLFNTFATLAIGVFSGSASTIAFWSLSMTLINAMQSLYSPISTALYPHMIAKRDINILRILLVFPIPILIMGVSAVCLFAEPIMIVFGGDNYISGAPLLRFLSPILFLSYYSIVLGWPVLGAFDKVQEITRTTVVAGAFTVIAFFTVGILGVLTMCVAAVLRVTTELILAFSRACIVFKKKADFTKLDTERF